MVTIKHRGRKYSFLFTIWAWYICCDELKCELFELKDQDGLDVMFNTIYGAYIVACLKTKQRVKSKDKVERITRKLLLVKKHRDKIEEAMENVKIMGRTAGQILEETEK